MRILMLTMALIAMAAPAFANCGGNHEATASTSTSDTVATTTSTPATPAPAPSGG